MVCLILMSLCQLQHGPFILDRCVHVPAMPRNDKEVKIPPDQARTRVSNLERK